MRCHRTRLRLACSVGLVLSVSSHRAWLEHRERRPKGLSTTRLSQTLEIDTRTGDIHTYVHQTYRVHYHTQAVWHMSKTAQCEWHIAPPFLRKAHFARTTSRLSQTASICYATQICEVELLLQACCNIALLHSCGSRAAAAGLLRHSLTSLHAMILNITILRPR